MSLPHAILFRFKKNGKSFADLRSEKSGFHLLGDCGGGLVIFCVATSAIVIPMIVYQIMNKMGKVGHIVTLHGDEKTFEEAFPPINKVEE